MFSAPFLQTRQVPLKFYFNLQAYFAIEPEQYLGE